jgi:ribosomal protein S12 methylthiotransferase accessory factor
MRLASAPKVFGQGVHRVVAPERTFAQIEPVARRAGVTRLSDITHLDRIGIPAYSAVVPRSRDIVSIYNGKGATRIDAACGALMEAIERQSALELKSRIVSGSHAELSRSTRTLDPASLVQELHPRYTDRLPLQWVEGWDLVSDSAILVPARVAGYCAGQAYGPPCLQLDTTNGLASGNVLEEAICHALCEVIERDSWTMAELLAQWLPLWKYKQVNGASTPPQGLDDIARYPELDLTEADGGIRWMLRRFARAGLCPRVKDITSDIGVPTIFATVIDDSVPDLAMAHGGAGTHPDARIAAMRALAEVAQSRVVDIQGVREDISQPDDVVPVYMRHIKRLKTVDRRNWYHCPAPSRRRLADIPTAVHSDILDDIRFMIDRLVARGLKQVIVVDLTDPALRVPVARVIVPGLESWAVDRNRIGDRATALWSANE